MAKEISIGDEVWVHGYVDEIRKDCIIIRNDGGYFGTIEDEIVSRDSDDVYAVKRLGEEIGYGHLMGLAHELWARYLEEKGLSREGAHCVVGYSQVKEEYQKYALNDPVYKAKVERALGVSVFWASLIKQDAINDPIYKVKVERALADTPQTDCDTCRYGQDKHRYAHICNECVEGINNYTPQTEEPPMDEYFKDPDEFYEPQERSCE